MDRTRAVMAEGVKQMRLHEQGRIPLPNDP